MSRTIDLVSCQADEQKIATAIAEEGLLPDIEHCYAEAAHRMRKPDTPEDSAVLLNAITRYLRTGGANMSPDAQKDFIAGVMDALEDFPVELTVEAILQARFKCRFASQVLPFVLETIQPIIDVRQPRLDTYARLWQIGMTAQKRIAS